MNRTKLTGLRCLLALSLAGMALLLVPPPAAHAATIYVNTTVDQYNYDPAHCSLREAVQAANNNGPFGGCPAGSSGADVVVLPAGTYSLIVGNLSITEDLTITDDGTSGATIEVPSGYLYGVIYATGPLTLNALTIRAGNRTSGGGGGIYFYDVDGTLILRHCTVYGNVANSGGGIYMEAGSLVVTNSTISGNSARRDGGGIYAGSGVSVQLNNATIADNAADTNTGDGYTGSGGGIYKVSNATVRMRNSIVAYGSPQNCGGNGTPTSQDYNVVSDATCNLIQTHDQPSTNPLLGALAHNGGPTWTHALSAGSPPRDAGHCNDSGGSPVVYDQRFATRPYPAGGSCDIGAYEYQAPLLVVLASFAATPQPGQVRVTWSTLSELDHAGFHLWRSEAAGGEYARLNAALIPAQGGPTQPASYAFEDAAVTDGVTYYYRLEAVDLYGQSQRFGPVHATAGMWHRIYLPVIQP